MFPFPEGTFSQFAPNPGGALGSLESEKTARNLGIAATESTICVKDIGIYVRDSFDFNGEQFLGFWNSNTNYGGKNPLRGTGVANKHFREFAKRTQKGGDYLVFSDVNKLKIDPPLIIAK